MSRPCVPFSLKAPLINMPPINPKNMNIPGAANDLGLSGGQGDQLQDQLDAELEQRRKLKQQQGSSNLMQGIYGPSDGGSASAMLGILGQSQGGLGGGR